MPMKKRPATKRPATKRPAAPLKSALPPRRPGEVRYWLLKSEPEVFSFEDLLAAPGRTTFWDG